MIRLIFIIFFSAITHFVLSQDTRTIKFKPNRVKLFLDIPDGYVFVRLEGDHGEKINKYIYNDSSIVYVTTFQNTPNYSNIRKQGTYYKKFMVQDSGDTLLLRGVDSLGKYWKNKSFGGLSIGYKNISFKDKVAYDEVINSFRRRRRKRKR